MKSANSIDQYISKAPEEVQEKLIRLREILLQTAPDAEEVISYGMPAIKWNGKVLVYFAFNKAHIGFYPTAKPIVVFKKDLLKFKTSKGAIQFPLDKRLPVMLIRKIVKYRMNDVKLNNAR